VNADAVLLAALFWALALLCCSYAVIFGGRDGRWATLLLLAAAGLTAPATLFGRAWGELELAILAVDLLLLSGLYALMLASRRYWPIWMTGFHLVAVVTHLSTMVAPSFTPRLYKAMESFWAIPVLLSLLIGVELDRRALSRARALVAPGEDPGRER
jgi:hypothetical protein